MSLDTHGFQLARRQLEAGICELERIAEQGGYDTMCIRAFASAAAVLAQSDLAERALQLLRAAPDGAFWAGMITNIELPETVPDRMRSIDTNEVLQRRHPPYCKDDIVKQIQSNPTDNGHLVPCLSDQFDEARLIAKSGVRLEEVGETLAILGKFDAALSVAHDPKLDKSRQQGVMIVVLIEMWRYGRAEEALKILTELETTGLGVWTRVQLSLGFGGREPWGGYPWPDW